MLVCLTDDTVIEADEILYIRSETRSSSGFCQICEEWDCHHEQNGAPVAVIYFKNPEYGSLVVPNATAKEVYMAIGNGVTLEEQESIERLVEKGM